MNDDDSGKPERPTDREQKVLGYLRERIASGDPPSAQAISAAMGWTKNAALPVLVSLEKKGYIEFDYHHPATEHRPAKQRKMRSMRIAPSSVAAKEAPERKPERPTCATCPYWHIDPDDGGPKEDGYQEAECRRYPPAMNHGYVMTAGPKLSSHASGMMAEASSPCAWHFPVTSNTDFCGEHPDFAAYVAATRKAKGE